MKFRTSILASLAIFSAFLMGCAGYHIGDSKPAAYAGIKKLYIPPFRNQTLEPRLSSLVTNAVLIELQSDGTYSVANKSDADAMLVGTIRRIEKRQLRAVRTDTLRSRELSVYLYIDFQLVDPRTGAQIKDFEASDGDDDTNTRWENTGDGVDRVSSRRGSIIAQTIQFVDQSFQVGERNALSVVSEDAAKKIVSQLANGW